MSAGWSSVKMDDGFLYAVRTPGPAIVIVLEGNQPVRAIFPGDPDDIRSAVQAIPRNVCDAIEVALSSELRAHGIDPRHLREEPAVADEQVRERQTLAQG